MILADKIITLRKKNGWSQEELAEKVNVSRQAVSKWEGALTVPDLDKVILLAQVFGVTTDFLLKDELEIEEYVSDDKSSDTSDNVKKVHKVSLEDANKFLDISKTISPRIALGVFLCIISPIALILLVGASETGLIAISEDKSAAIGMVALMTLVASAVALFVSSNMRENEFEFLGKEPIETAYGVSGMVKERKSDYKETFSLSNIVGVTLCVLSVIPLFIGIAIAEENEFLILCCVCLLLFLVALGCFFIVNAGCRQGALQKLLEEGDYTREKKESKALGELVSGAYWMVTTAIYLLISFLTGRWDITWVVWPVAALLFGAIALLWQPRKKD